MVTRRGGNKPITVTPHDGGVSPFEPDGSQIA